MIFLRLFYEFFKTGLFAVGGGLATLPFLSDMAQKTGWFTQAELADMIAVSESTPGPIGVNMATFAGFKCAGVPGGIIATLGLITPSIIIILLIAKFLASFSESIYVKGAFYGLRPASVAMITAAGFLVVRLALLDTAACAASHSILQLFRWKELLLAVVLYFAMRKSKLHPILFIAASMVAGILFHMGGV